MSAIDGKLLAALLDQHAAALELFAAQRCQTPADVVQHAFIQLARQKTLPDNVVGWLYRVVRNGALSAARAESRRLRHERTAATMRSWFRPASAGQIDAGTASDELARLPVEEREVIVAHLWGGLSFEQIAALVDTSTSTAHRRYQSGLETLRRTLGAPCTKTNPTRPS